MRDPRRAEKKPNSANQTLERLPAPATPLKLIILKVIIAGETVLEVDKYNYISNIGGTDYLADVREALGLN